jgi:hypothetical protein
MTDQTEYIYNPPSRLRLADGSVWGSEAITDLRNKFHENQAKTLELQRELQEAKTQLAAARQAKTDFMNRLVALQTNVRDGFRELVDDGDLDIEKANELLESSFGLEPLAVTWEFEATVRVRGYGKAPKEEDIEDALGQASWDVSTYTSRDVDDLEVQEVEIETYSADRVMP